MRVVEREVVVSAHWGAPRFSLVTTLGLSLLGHHEEATNSCEESSQEAGIPPGGKGEACPQQQPGQASYPQW